MRDPHWTERDPLPRLWRVAWGGTRGFTPDHRGWMDNARRSPRGQCLLQYTAAGALRVERDGQVRSVPQGFAALMWYGEDSRYGLEPAVRGYEERWVILEGPGLLDAWSDLIGRCAGVVGPDANGLLRHDVERLIAAPAPRTVSARLAHADAVHRLVLDLYRMAVAAPRAQGLTAAIAALRADPCGCGTVAEVARRHGLSREHLSRAAREALGLPAQQFLQAQRLTQATALLEHGTPLGETARRCGYASVRGLTRALARLPADLKTI